MESNPLDAKPGIIVLSKDDDDSFDWLSDGWYNTSVRGTPHAEMLMVRARSAVGRATDVPDAIKRLEDEGFRIIRRD